MRTKFFSVLLAIAASRCRGESWVVVVSTSRFWSNYRHAANAFAIGAVARSLGVEDDHILTFLADPCACSAQNVFHGDIFLNANGPNLATRVDRAYSRVSPLLVRHTLTGRNGLLKSDENSDVVLYMTGHGGDGFLKFHDSDELSAIELARAIEEMKLKKRYRKLLLIVDTCQAASLFQNIMPDSRVVGFASSVVGQNAYATHPDPVVGVALADRFTQALANSFFRGQVHGNTTLGQLAAKLDRTPTRSTLYVHENSWQTSSADDSVEEGELRERLPPWQTARVSEFFSKPSHASSSGPKFSEWPYAFPPP